MPDIVPLAQVLEPNVRQTLLQAIHQFASSMSGPDERLESIELTLKRTLLKGTPSNEETTRLIGAFVEATSALEFSNNDPHWMKEHRRRLR